MVNFDINIYLIVIRNQPAHLLWPVFVKQIIKLIIFRRIFTDAADLVEYFDTNLRLKLAVACGFNETVDQIRMFKKQWEYWIDMVRKGKDTPDIKPLALIEVPKDNE